MNAILVLNAGSSSIKFSVFEHIEQPDPLKLVFTGHAALVGSESELIVKDGDGKQIEQLRTSSSSNSFDKDQGMQHIFQWLNAYPSRIRFVAVGHRVVHGGSRYLAPVQMTREILGELDALIPLAPLHQPHALAAIRIASGRWPTVPQVACFDTAFHSTLPWVAQALALPPEITSTGLRGYGFHGLSYEYIVTQLPRVLGDLAGGKVIVAHLGNGASLCSLSRGQSVATTMGFSVLDGLVMGTRCGTLDPGALLYLLQHFQMSPDEVSDLLYSRSGLLGVSGISGNMQVLLASSDERATKAIDLFVYRIVCEIGALAAAMGGVDALVFTGGIGEKAAAIRSQVCKGCAWLGAVVDDVANGIDMERIHTPHSRLQLAVVPTNEELMIALHTRQLVG